MAHAIRSDLVDVGPLEDLGREGVRVVSAGERAVAVFHHDGGVSAVDNRCPHMGFPLHRGTVRDGILTCHWHHAKFDLAGGCTFDPWADDVAAYHVEVRDGRVWLDPTPPVRDGRAHWLRKLETGLEHRLSLLLAKAVVGLEEAEATADALTAAALFGVRNRDAGWSDGLSILTAAANIRPHLAASDRPRALFHGLVHVARATAGHPPSFDLDPLETGETDPDRYRDWFRRFIEVRAGDAAERTLRTAIRIGLPKPAVADMVFAACTDHVFLDVGHALDFANKAFELLDHLGWAHAEEILSALVPPLVEAQRMEEASSWRHPVDLPALHGEATEDLEALLQAPRRPGWDGHAELAELVLHGDPAEILTTLRELIQAGVEPTALSAAVAYAAVRRAAHFPVSNEIGDWDTVHHTFTYANAVDQALRRTRSPLVVRGVFDAALSVYLERFLNVPRRPMPEPAGGASPEALLAAFDRQGDVDAAGQAVVDLLAADRPGDVIETLGHALLREDAGFHAHQMVEAGFRQYHGFAQGGEGGRRLAGHVLVGVARFLAARFPTIRSRWQTYDIAERLHRGEDLHAETLPPSRDGRV
jgi:nitrite reductase/ring-hydroxylating ferredoxin subunit